jgi:hypothetical protein
MLGAVDKVVCMAEVDSKDDIFMEIAVYMGFVYNRLLVCLDL